MLAEQLFPDITCPLPEWMPEKWQDALAGTHKPAIFTGGELDALHRVPYRPMSEWADDGGYVAIGAHGGDWSREVTPHADKIMDTWWQPTTREVVFCSIEQDGKTAVMYNCLGGSQDMDPGPAMLIMPTEKKAGDVATERLHPMFRNSRLLKRLVSNRVDDLTRTMIRLNNGARIFLAWANSADALSSWPIKYLFFDETDKYPEFVGKEANPITLGEKRVRNFEFDYKIFKSSTPSRESGYIHRELESCQQIWEWHLRCTHCGDTFHAGAEHLVIPKDATIDTLLPGSVHLACPHCGGLMTESERRFATRTGKWVCRKGADLVDPEKVGFHRRAYDCKDISLYKIALAKLKADSGDIEAKIAWANGFEAINYEEKKADRKEDAILKLCDDRPEGLVPSVPIAAITCVADMQKRGFWYKVTAWGFGLEQESWLLKAGFVDTFEGLRQIMFESRFEDVNRNQYIINLRGMDSGGGEGEEHADLSRTAEAYLFAAANPGVILFKGKRHLARQFMSSDIDRIPGTNRPLPGSAKLYTINSTFFKDKLAGKLLVGGDDPGAWHLHSGFTVDQQQLRLKGERVDNLLEDFSKQMCAEYRTEQGHYECPRGKANHYWDCAYMEMALVEIAQVKLLAKPDQQAAAGGRKVRSSGV